MKFFMISLVVLLFAGVASVHGAEVDIADATPGGKPLAVADLGSREGAMLMGGQWRYSDVSIKEIGFVEADENGQPGSVPNRTYDYEPKAGVMDFDDSLWPVIAPGSLSKRRGGGKLSFNWYRIRLTVPERIGDFDPTGSTIVFETIVDDYAEVWVNGELPRRLGQLGGSVAAGFNAPNRLVVGRNVRLGQTIQLAVFGINSPISQAPTNYIFLRYAKLEFHPGPSGPLPLSEREVNIHVERLDRRAEDIFPANPKLFKLAEGFVGARSLVAIGDDILIGDAEEKRIYKRSDAGALSVFLDEAGSMAGLTLDANGRVAAALPEAQSVSRLNDVGTWSGLAHSHDGKTLNGPVDAVFAESGDMYFIDAAGSAGPAGVYLLKNGRTRRLTSDATARDSLALSPDGSLLYTAGTEAGRVLMQRFPISPDGGLDPADAAVELSGRTTEGDIAGLSVDDAGNVYVVGLSEMIVLSAKGEALAEMQGPRRFNDAAFGDSSLYLIADDGLYRLPLKVTGGLPGAPK